jgi:hypothetical protein
MAASLDDINIYEFTYSSTHKKHFWKKREVALFLVGSFVEDIQMYRQRNPHYNLKKLVQEMMKTQFDKALIKSYIKGRTLYCASQLAEIMPKDYEEVHKDIIQLAIQFLIEEPLISIKLVATRCLIKYSRKLKPDVLQSIISERFEDILDQLTALLDTSSLESLYLPIEAFTSYSRLNEGIVA